MAAGTSSNRWVFAIFTAVLFPALALHFTCVAVMGPGTWGAGMEEVLPELHEPDARARQYREQLAASSGEAAAAAEGESDAAGDPELEGKVAWTSKTAAGTAYLTEDRVEGKARQRLFVRADQLLREISLPEDHVVVRPQAAAGGILYERWNPWAVPAAAKIGRYLVSWADRSLRPEAALYKLPDAAEEWDFLMPGHSLSVSPDGRRAVFLRSGALLAGYYTVYAWNVGSDEPAAIASLREHGREGTKSFSINWSPDSEAIGIRGRTGGFERRASQDGEGVELDWAYVFPERKLYDFRLGG